MTEGTLATGDFHMPDTSAAGHPPEPATVEVLDEVPRRVRRPLDLARITGLVLVIALIGGLAILATNTVQGANQDTTRLLSHLPRVFVHVLSLVGTFGALALPIAIVIRELVRGHARRLLEGFVTGLIAIGLVGVLNRVISADSTDTLHRALTQVGTGTAPRPLDAYLAALFALVVVIGVAEPAWRGAFWGLAGFYVLSAFTAAQASLLSLMASPAIGALVAVVARYAVGSPNVRPRAQEIAQVLMRRGLEIVRMERTSAISGEHRSYLATGAAGVPLRVLVFDRDQVASGAAYRLYRRLRLRADVALPPALSLERVADRRALLALAAMAAGACTPRFVAGVPCGPDTIALVHEQVAATALENPTDGQLRDLWGNVVKLHRDWVTHRGVSAGRVLLGSDGQVILPILTDGEAFASELRIRLDRAEVLIATAQLAGAERAVRVARTIVTAEELAATLPVLQPVAFSRETRAALKKDSALLEALSDQLQGETDRGPSEPIRVERFRPRTVVSIVALIVAAYLLVGQLGSVNLATVFSSARLGWIPFVLLASAGTYVGAALSLTGFVQEKLSFVRTLLVQLAASFVGFVTPPSVGGLAINIRYLRAARVRATAAATSVGAGQVINAAVHAVLLVVFAAATGAASPTSLPIPGWVFIALGLLAAVALLALTVPGPRRWALARTLPPLREAAPRMLGLLTSPAKLAEALAGTVLLNACYTAALWFSVQAFAGDLNFAAVAVVYLGGAAVASVAPTPGGLGAVEVALSSGLTAAGMPGASALSAVLLFRIATFWLPVPAGWVALRELERRHAL
jgi:glycosyltransferase 2 family protein